MAHSEGKSFLIHIFIGRITS